MNTSEIVYGERIDDLLPGLFAVQDSMTIGHDGMCHYSATLEREVGQPLQRAMMRVEAELLLQDADTVGTEHEVVRTYEQRAADGYVRVAKAVGHATRKTA
ncbi:MAG: hypothetical protein QOI95_710 [Acidimicrobiaceae bacterium]|jgi:hypothetical protein